MTTTKIDPENKKYRTRDGCPVRFLGRIKHPTHPLLFAVPYNDITEVVYSYGEDGVYSERHASVNDLIEVSPYEDFKINDPVMVSDNFFIKKWVKRHFAGVNLDGKAFTFPSGTTSFSYSPESLLQAWNFCRRPTPEELGDYK